jgi:hypothetical protein
MGYAGKGARLHFTTAAATCHVAGLLQLARCNSYKGKMNSKENSNKVSYTEAIAHRKDSLGIYYIRKEY